MSDLIKITTNEEGKQLVSARELHEFLEIKTDFRKWFPRMCEYGFEENIDYTPVKFVHPMNLQECTDYAISIDMAKELSMIQRTEKGKQARLYFIECEKKLKAIDNKAQLLLDIYNGGEKAIAASKKLHEIEEWKDIKGYEGLYQVSNLGRVKSLPRKYAPKERILKPEIGKRGYPYVVFSYNKERKTLKIHRLVAETFIPNPDNLPQVNHKDENKSNNCVENLEWCTNGYNVNYGDRNKKVSDKLSGFNSKRSKRIYCIELNKYFGSLREAERETKVSHNIISYCCKGIYKQAGGYTWKFI